MCFVPHPAPYLLHTASEASPRVCSRLPKSASWSHMANKLLPSMAEWWYGRRMAEWLAKRAVTGQMSHLPWVCLCTLSSRCRTAHLCPTMPLARAR